MTRDELLSEVSVAGRPAFASDLVGTGLDGSRSTRTGGGPAAGGGQAAALSGPLCTYSSGSSDSRTSRMTFDGRGAVAWGSELAVPGEVGNGPGEPPVGVVRVPRRTSPAS